MNRDPFRPPRSPFKLPQDGRLAFTHDVVGPQNVQVTFSMTLIAIEARPGPYDDVEIDAKMLVPDRETGQPIEVRFSERVPSSYIDARSWPEIVRGHLMSMVRHEVNESLKVDGVRIFDPHKDEPIVPPMPRFT